MKIDNLGIFVGSGECNANCQHCCGLKFRPCDFVDGGDDFECIEEVVKCCHIRGCRKYSISGSGEPLLSPLSVTKTLELLKRLCDKPMIKLYTNGIQLGDRLFCQEHLTKWSMLGLKTICFTVYGCDNEINNRIYKTKNYPGVKNILSVIKQFGFEHRVNILLHNDAFRTVRSCLFAIDNLLSIGVEKIVCNQVRSNITDMPDFKITFNDEQARELSKLVKKNMMSDKVEVRYGETICGAKGDHYTLFPDGKVQITFKTPMETIILNSSL